MNIQKAILFPLAFAALAIVPSQGSIVEGTNLRDGGGTGTDLVVTFEMAPIEAGQGILALGYFGTLDDTTVEGTSILDAPTVLASDFVAVASDDFSNLGGEPGLYFASGEHDPSASVLGKTLYSFIGNSVTLAGSTAFGLYRHNAIVDGDMPPIPESDTLLLEDGLLIHGSFGPKVIIDSPSFGDNYETDSLELQQIPEPSGMLLSLLGGLFCLRRRR